MQAVTLMVVMASGPVWIGVDALESDLDAPESVEVCPRDFANDIS